jgi:hypothetical protein
MKFKVSRDKEENAKSKRWQNLIDREQISKSSPRTRRLKRVDILDTLSNLLPLLEIDQVVLR